jgi:hypothetical protein
MGNSIRPLHPLPRIYNPSSSMNHPREFHLHPHESFRVNPIFPPITNMVFKSFVLSHVDRLAKTLMIID